MLKSFRRGSKVSDAIDATFEAADEAFRVADKAFEEEEDAAMASVSSRESVAPSDG